MTGWSRSPSTPGRPGSGGSTSRRFSPPVSPGRPGSLEKRALFRVRYTSTQTRLKRTERRENIRGAFSVPAPDRVRGASLLLVDDVYTTGATVNECAATLMEAGAKNVDVLTLARAVHR